MELAPLFLLLLLPPADTTGEVAAGIQASLRHELGNVAMAVAPTTLVTPAMWQGENAQLRARFVARVEWTAPDKANVELLAGPSASEPVARTRALAFAPQDGKSERGRAIGLALAELLRESPASAFTDATAATAASAGPSPGSRVALGSLFVVERVMGGNWGMGSKLTSGFALGEAIRLQASGWALFGSADQYMALGFGLGIRWDFLQARHGAHAVGVGLVGDLFRESASASSDGEHMASTWNLGLGAQLAGRMTVWRSLRVVGEFDLWTVAKTMTLKEGEDATERTYSFSRWRPGFAAGVELGL